MQYDAIPDFQSTRDEAKFTINIEDSIPEIDIYLLDLVNNKWDLFGTTSSWHTEIIEFKINNNFEPYFDTLNRTYVRFYNPMEICMPKYFRVDMIDLTFLPGIYFDMNIENKTYYRDHLESGFYPATFGFENDKNGEFPARWFEEGDPGYIAVIKSFEGHKKVMYLNDVGAVYLSANQTFEVAQTSGSIGLWMYLNKTSINHRTRINFKNGTGDNLAQIYFHGEDSDHCRLGYRNGSSDVDTSLNALKKWLHLSIDFSGDGTYKGLSPNCYNFTIRRSNGSIFYESSELDYNNYNTGDCAHLQITASMTGVSKICVDAVGYSWDPNYNIENCLEEGLLLKFNNHTTLDWIGYSLDGQLNRTILGNTTISYPDDGHHSIQMFGNNSLGTIYKSDKIYFTITSTEANITLDTPIDIPIIPVLDDYPIEIYIEPNPGHYYATYSFEGNEDGSFPPRNWTTHPIYYAGMVLASEEDHNKVVEVDNIDDNIYNLDNNFDPQVNGTIEFWFKTTNVLSDPQRFRILQDNDIGPDIRIYQNRWQYRIGSTWSNIYQENGIDRMTDPLNNTWTHVRIDFECGDGGYKVLGPDTYRVIIDNLTSQAYGFRFGSRDYISTFSFWTGGTASAFYRVYMDAVGYSWDEHYEIGDNLKKGLLFDFFYPDTIELDWMAYSLDGQPNRTIYGEFLIPFPEDGNHTLQIFGEDINGNIIKSRLLHFFIDTSAPNISVSFTHNAGPWIVNQTTLFTLIPDDDVGSGIAQVKYKINNTEWLDYIGPFNLSHYAPGFYNISYYAIDYAGHIGDMINITVELIIVSLIDVDIVRHMYSTEVFNITICIYDELGQGIESATIQLWWDGSQVPQNDITPLGGGKYVLSLNSISVAPGDDPILLNMTISADRCFNKYFETHIAVDPEMIDEGGPSPTPPPSGDGDDDDAASEELPLVLFIVVLGASITVVSIAFIIAWKKELLTKLKRN